MIKRAINSQKASRVAALVTLVSKAKSIGIVDYTKMTPPQATELRKLVKTAGGEIKVEKNTLFRIAMQSSSAHYSLLSTQLKGLSAFIFSNQDEISALKVVSDFIKKNNLLTFKMGIVGDRVLNQNDIVLLAQTPSKDVSLRKLLYLLNYNTSRLVRTLEVITNKITHPA